MDIPEREKMKRTWKNVIERQDILSCFMFRMFCLAVIVYFVKTAGTYNTWVQAGLIFWAVVEFGITAFKLTENFKNV